MVRKRGRRLPHPSSLLTHTELVSALGRGKFESGGTEKSGPGYDILMLEKLSMDQIGLVLMDGSSSGGYRVNKRGSMGVEKGGLTL